MSKSDQNILIKAENISVMHGDVETLQSISLDIKAAEILTLIGPNGAGKSTLIKCLLGIQDISKGKIWRKTGLSMAYMPQKIQIDRTFPLSVERFLRLAGKYRKDEIQQVLNILGAEQLKDKNVHSLSGGEFQRILLARALLPKPELLVLDEPTQGVDISGQQELFELLNHVREAQNCAILMVSHDLHLVMSTTDQVICLNKHICCSGHPESVSNDPAYQQLFGIKDSEGFAIYEHHHDHDHDVSGKVKHKDHSC